MEEGAWRMNAGGNTDWFILCVLLESVAIVYMT